MKKTISVQADFSEYPGLRYSTLSDFSGEEFYHQILNTAFYEVYQAGDILTIDLDNTAGYASSFLDEAFGNLVYDFTLANVKKHVEIISVEEPHWKEMIEQQTYLQWEQRRQKKEPPKVTSNHEAWYRLKDNKLCSEIWEQPSVSKD